MFFNIINYFLLLLFFTSTNAKNINIKSVNAHIRTVNMTNIIRTVDVPTYVITKNKEYNNTKYYFRGIIIRNKQEIETHAKKSDDYIITLVAATYFNKTIIDTCKKTRTYKQDDAKRWRKKFPIGQSVLWRTKKLGGKC